MTAFTQAQKTSSHSVQFLLCYVNSLAFYTNSIAPGKPWSTTMSRASKQGYAISYFAC